jgi:hypothetical protein
VVFFKNAKQVYKRQDYLFTFLMVFSAMYLSFKQQFTDLSAKNAMAYFLFIPPLLSLLWIFLRDSDRWFSRLAISSLVLSIIAFQLLRYENSATTNGYWQGFFPKEVVYFKAKYDGPTNKNKKPEPMMDFLNIVKLHTPYGYVKSLMDNQFTTYFPKYNTWNRALPKPILDLIGDKSVDILPNETSYIFYNKLNYNPRPTIQSSQTIDNYLDAKNVEKYQSKSAPDFLLSQYINAPNRNFIWQETKTKLAVMANYEKIKLIKVPQYRSSDNSTSFDTLSLYKKRNKSLQITEKQIVKSTIRFNQTFEIPQSNNPIILRTNFKYSFTGLFTRYFFQAPFVYCILELKNGEKQKYRAIVPQFDNGLIINKIANNNSELDRFFAGLGTPKNTIKSIRFESKNSWGFLPEIDVEMREVELK